MMKKLTLCIAVLASMSIHANTNPLGKNAVDLKSTGYIDIERVKSENPVPQINIEEQRQNSETILKKFKAADSQSIPESTIKRLELGDIAVKPQVTPDAINTQNLKNQIGAIDLEQMAKKYNEALNKKELNHENPAEELTAGKAHLFISGSMPKETLKAMMNDAGRLGITVFLKGNMGEDPLKFAGTKAFLDTLNLKTPPELFIHPDAFKMFNIERVPALVVSASTVNDNLDEQGCAAPTDFDIIHGDLSLTANLTRIFENASSPDIKDIARQYMKKVNVTGN